MKSGTFILFLTLLSSLHCQITDLDEIFEDRETELGIFLGTDFLRIASGTPNIRSSGLVFSEHLLLNLEIGAPLFGYRLQGGFLEIEKQVKPGIESSISGLIQIFNLNKWQDVRMYLGGEYQYWRYNSESKELAELNGMVEGNSNFNYQYGYSLNSDSRFLFNHVSNGFGIVYGISYETRNKGFLDIYLHGGIESRKSRFDKEKSYGVQWINNEPNGYIKGFFGSGTGYARLSLTYKLRL